MSHVITPVLLITAISLASSCTGKSASVTQRAVAPAPTAGQSTIEQARAPVAGRQEMTESGQDSSITPRPNSARIGQRAPDFELLDVDGRKVRLSQYRGKVVVLEWYNPDCPFVAEAHTRGALTNMARRSMERDVVWLAINSGAPGRQGHGKVRNKRSVSEYELPHTVLLDEGGTVGKAYAAKTTPHMYIIDSDGNLAYRGGLDSSFPNGSSPYKNYTQLALDQVLASERVLISETRPWGCSVKYAN